MALERFWGTVAPTLLILDGTAVGLITVADTAGFKVKGLAQLANNVNLQMVVQVNQVLSSTQMLVGKPGSSPSASVGGIASGAIVDVSAFKVADGATIGFGQQPKNKIKPDDAEVAVYESDPTVAYRTVPVDQYGNIYSTTNPLPANIWTAQNFPFTFGMLGLPNFAQTLLNGIFYDTVISQTTGNIENLSFYDKGSLVDTLSFEKTSTGWMLNLIEPSEGFLELESGGFLIQEDSGHIIV